MSEPLLHACPHCTGPGYFAEMGDSITFVACKSCGAQGGPVNGTGFVARQIAAEKWNTRGGLGSPRVALVNPSVPIETFKLIERVRETAERLEKGELGEPDCGAMLLHSRERKSLTISELRLRPNELQGIIGAVWSSIDAKQRIQVVK